MTREQAEALMASLLRLEGPLNEMSAILEAFEDGEEKSDLMRALGDLMGHVYVDLMRPVIRQYPELDPEPRE